MNLKQSYLKFRESTLFRIARNKFFLATVLFALWVTFFDSNNLIKWSKVIINLSKQESQKSYYKEEIESLEERLNELSSNRDSLEKFAREQYLFKERDEEIFVVE